MIAQRPFDTASTDYLFVEACNLIHKRLYAEALNVLKGALEFAKDTRSKEMLLFNSAFCHFKINHADPRAREIWATQISEKDVYFKTLASLNIAILTYLFELKHTSKKPSVYELDVIHKCT